MRYFIDHNVAGIAIAFLGGIEQTSDITTAPAGVSTETDVQRTVVNQALAGQVALVTSETTLETLRRMLVKGGPNFEALHPDSAVEAVNILRTISISSGGYVATGAVRANRSVAEQLTDNNRDATGAHDLEDAFVVATVLGALGADDEQPAVIVTNDGGLNACASSLQRRNIAVLRAQRWVRAIGA